MRIVIDLGCKGYGGPDESTSRLLKRFKPHLYYGFDPALDRDEVRMLDNTVCIFSRKAAWIHNGHVWFEHDMLKSGVSLYSKTTTEEVPCFRFATWLGGLPEGEVIVKMDVEGAEYPLLNDLYETMADERIARVLVERHTGDYARGLEQPVPYERMRCEIEEWA